MNCISQRPDRAKTWCERLHLWNWLNVTLKNGENRIDKRDIETSRSATQV
jgi:hypothetical protein